MITNNITRISAKGKSKDEGKIHCMKSVRILSFSGPHFPAFVLNIQSEYRKIRTRKTPNTDTFYAVINIMLFTNKN